MRCRTDSAGTAGNGNGRRRSLRSTSTTPVAIQLPMAVVLRSATSLSRTTVIQSRCQLFLIAVLQLFSYSSATCSSCSAPPYTPWGPRRISFQPGRCASPFYAAFGYSQPCPAGCYCQNVCDCQVFESGSDCVTCLGDVRPSW